MSFKLFVYYCSVCGAWAAFVGWAFGRLLLALSGNEVTQDVLQGTTLGFAVALALGTVDAVWNMTGHNYGPVVGRGLLAGSLGAAGAALGSFVGAELVRRTSRGVLVVPGWTLTGLLIGASLGALDYLAGRRGGDRSWGGRRKLVNGLSGGTLGGLLGGLLFVAFRATAGRLFAHKRPEELLSGTALGFVSLGACIGLFVGLAQVLLKEAWVRVESGRRAGRDFLLSREETTLGRSEACDVGLFGDGAVERLHARIVLRDGEYLLSDAGTEGGTFLNEERIAGPAPLRDGDTIRVGASVLRFGERRKRRK